MQKIYYCSNCWDLCQKDDIVCKSCGKYTHNKDNIGGNNSFLFIPFQSQLEKLYQGILDIFQIIIVYRQRIP